MFALYVCTLWIAYMVKVGTKRHCPQCKHLVSSHLKREDGSFID